MMYGNALTIIKQFNKRFIQRVTVYGHCLSSISPEHGLFFSLFAGGLIGGVSHCTGMCGPLVLGQIGALPSRSGIITRMLLPYHMGRITTYALLAVIFSSVVNFAVVYSLPKMILSVLLLSTAALMFLVTAIPGLAVIFPWLTRLHLPAPAGLIGRLSQKLMINPAGWRGYMLGILLGFMPCGLVIAALMAASTAGSPVTAALAMGAFGLGTMPVLVTIACGGGWIKHKWPVHIKVFSSIIMAVNSLILFWLAARMAI